MAPFCSECGMEYRAGVFHCRDCGCALAGIEEGEVAANEEFHDLGELKLLATFGMESEAKMIRELLESNAIRTVMRGDTDPIGVASGATPVAILVGRADLREAQNLLGIYFTGDPAMESNGDA